MRYILIKDKRGFTAIELIIIIAILAILTAVVVPSVSSLITTGNITAANIEALNIKTAASAYASNNGSFPSDSDYLWNDPTETDEYISSPPRAYYIFDTNTGKITNATFNTPGHIPDSPWVGIKWDNTIDLWVKQ